MAETVVFISRVPGAIHTNIHPDSNEIIVRNSRGHRKASNDPAPGSKNLVAGSGTRRGTVQVHAIVIPLGCTV